MQIKKGETWESKSEDFYVEVNKDSTSVVIYSIIQNDWAVTLQVAGQYCIPKGSFIRKFRKCSRDKTNSNILIDLIKAVKEGQVEVHGNGKYITEYDKSGPIRFFKIEEVKRPKCCACKNPFNHEE